MAVAAREVSTAETWGPVRRGFTVAFANGECGRLEEIRVADGSVELVVEAGAAHRLVVLDGDDVDAILPRRRRVVVGPRSRDASGGVGAAGGIVRMSARHSSRLGDALEQAV